MVEFKDAFSLFDQVGDGKVEKAQVPNILRSVGLNPTKHDVERVMETLKSRKDKRIEFEVFFICLCFARQEADRQPGGIHPGAEKF